MHHGTHVYEHVGDIDSEDEELFDLQAAIQYEPRALRLHAGALDEAGALLLPTHVRNVHITREEARRCDALKRAHLVARHEDARGPRGAL